MKSLMYGESLLLTFLLSIKCMGKEFWRVNLKIFYFPFAVYEIYGESIPLTFPSSPLNDLAPAKHAF